MAPLILDGRALAQELRAAISDEVAALAASHGRAPLLAVVHVLGDAAAERYVRSLRRACDQVGVVFRYQPLPATVTQAELEHELDLLSADPLVDGLLLQMPLPPRFESMAVVMHIDHRKDVDGINPVNVGLLFQGHPALVPNTPAGGIALLRRYGITIAGCTAVVVGRSAIVGQPMAGLLINANATVTVCHRQTRDLAAQLRQADIVVAAAGRAGMISGAMLKPGAVVIDFGINVQDDGSIVGDVDFASAATVCSAITPVPGGTGPVTTMMLLQNVLRAARAAR